MFHKGDGHVWPEKPTLMERHERQGNLRQTSVFISPFLIACKAIAQRLVPVNKPLAIYYPSFYFV